MKARLLRATALLSVAGMILSACGGGSSSKESSSEKATKEDSASIKATKEDSASIAAKGGKITCEEYISLD